MSQTLGSEAIKSQGTKVEAGEGDARILTNPGFWCFLAYRPGSFLVGPSLPVSQLELPSSCQVELLRERALGALGCPRARVSLDRQYWPSYPHSCSLPGGCFPPTQAQVILPS